MGANRDLGLFIYSYLRFKDSFKVCAIFDESILSTKMQQSLSSLLFHSYSSLPTGVKMLNLEDGGGEKLYSSIMCLLCDPK